MTARIDRILKDSRKFFRSAGEVIVASGSVDMIAALQLMKAMYQDALSSAYDEQHDCLHSPLFNPDLVQRLADRFAGALLTELDSAGVHQTCEDLLSQLRVSIPQHHRAEKERKRAPGRKDVVRLALCIAALSATDTVLNTIVARRISRRAFQRARSRSSRRAAR